MELSIYVQFNSIVASPEWPVHISMHISQIIYSEICQNYVSDVLNDVLSLVSLLMYQHQRQKLYELTEAGWF